MTPGPGWPSCSSSGAGSGLSSGWRSRYTRHSVAASPLTPGEGVEAIGWGTRGSDLRLCASAAIDRSSLVLVARIARSAQVRRHEREVRPPRGRDDLVHRRRVADADASVADLALVAVALQDLW